MAERSPKQNADAASSRGSGGSSRRHKSAGRRKHTFGVGKKTRKKKYDTSTKIPTITPFPACKLRELRLVRLKDWLLLEEEFLKNVQQNRPKTKDENAEDSVIEQLRGSPMLVGTLEELLDEKHAIVTVGPAELEYYVSIRSIVDKEALELNSKVFLNMRNYAIVGVLQDDFNPLLASMRVDRAPLESFTDIGGLEEQINELKESVELPLTNPELFEAMGIYPPRGVLLYGPPGTGKTLLAKAVANSTSATFLHVVGSELVQKTLGEGPKMVRDMFKLAQDYAPTIIFIDEVDAIGNKRNDSTSSGEKEVQRTMLELLNQLDGFDPLSEVKVIIATNNIQSLDPALIRPGRIDRKLEIPLPDERGKRKIFELQTARMTMEDNIDIDALVADAELSGADIKAMCTEAGFMALRQRRMKVSHADFRKAKDRVLLKKKEDEKEMYI